MPLRTRIFIMVGAGILVIGLISAFIIWRVKKPAAPVQTVAPTTAIDQSNFDKVKVGTEPTVVPKNAEITKPTAVQLEDITVRNLAKIFVERYHTYSSENNYQNIKDIQSIVTRTYWNKISVPLSSKTSPTNFVALTTKVVSIMSVDVNKDTASVVIKVSRVSTANGNTTLSYGESDVSLVKNDGTWLVSAEVVK